MRSSDTLYPVYHDPSEISGVGFVTPTPTCPSVSSIYTHYVTIGSVTDILASAASAPTYALYLGMFPVLPF